MSRRRRAARQETPEPWAALGAIVLIAFLLRLWRLTADLPVVGDESIYLRWAEIIDNQGRWFVSLLDGKPPLTYWLYAAARGLPPDDPLFGPRLLSVLAGTLTALGVYAVGRRLASPRAGLIAAGLYAILPWAMVYDRLAYAESFVNLAGVALVWASLRAFDRDASGWRDGLPPGLILALGFLTKTTILLLAPAPLLAAALRGRAGLKRSLPALAATYSAGALALALNAAMTPEAPRLETSSAVFHKTHFFVPPAELLAAPFSAVSENAPALLQFLTVYLTPPGLAAIAAAAVWMLAVRSRPAALLLALSAAPILAQAFLLDRTFSRYPYPHVWPLLVVLALAYERAASRPRLKIPAAVGLGVVAAAFAIGSFAAVRHPRDGLAPLDAAYYFGDGPNAGWGVAQAVAHIEQAARRGDDVLVLTDPIWGTPADAIFAYLNGRDGVRVAEAWWVEESARAPLTPAGEVEVWRSHYERTPGGKIRFQDYDSIFYVTVSNYHPQSEVLARQPNARLELSVPKPRRTQSLDVYRLR